MRRRLRNPKEQVGQKIDRSPASPLSSLLVFTINLYNFTFSLSVRCSEERRPTARGLIMKEKYVVLTCYKAQHPGPIAH